MHLICNNLYELAFHVCFISEVNQLGVVELMIMLLHLVTFSYASLLAGYRATASKMNLSPLSKCMKIQKMNIKQCTRAS